MALAPLHGAVAAGVHVVQKATGGHGLESRSVEAGAGTSVMEATERARQVAKPVGAFMALHCAMLTSKDLLGRTLRGVSSYCGFRESNVRLKRQAEMSLRDEKASGPMRKASKLSGEWKLVDATGQDEAMRMMGLGYVFRKATTLAKGLSLVTTQKDFRITTRASIIEISEAYPFDGSFARFPRRDKRGKHVAHITHVRQGSVEIRYEWPDPAKGTLIQVFRVEGENDLYIDNKLELEIDARTKKAPEPKVFHYTQHYKRA
eukprot:CAMPEP_0167786778 /NCGR_PEP_ID=MMETSP0111_2-20121227/9014_1 /TAXON_ID=91324 /ORGANISM="Lotharella globosa, Strain CCCM811" /LENGTH=260 /DNA_ID=CAMNT_0007678263 /DNA_START=165 /DNA_END=947 /DNA_ORIENTATION=-